MKKIDFAVVFDKLLILGTVLVPLKIVEPN
jgi:hypothetical protein